MCVVCWFCAGLSVPARAREADHAADNRAGFQLQHQLTRVPVVGQRALFLKIQAGLGGTSAAKHSTAGTALAAWILAAASPGQHNRWQLRVPGRASNVDVTSSNAERGCMRGQAQPQRR